MAEHNIQSKLVTQLKNDKIQLWNPPYTTDNGVGQDQMHELAEKYAALVGLPLLDVEVALENIRSQAVHKGSGNKLFREKCVATLELVLPKAMRKDEKKNYMETRLDVTAQDIIQRITEDFGMKYMKLILNGKTLIPGKRLDEQNVKNNSKLMVLKVSEPDTKRVMVEEEEKKRSQEECMQRTQKGFQILSERDGSEDPTTTPFLEIADQKGNPLVIPPSEKKALILAMGIHERGRTLMKRRQHEAALCYLLQADTEFSKCGSTLLSTVDNYAVLQLDILWCYRALEALTCLEDSKLRLQRAEDCFLKCYGERHQRLLQIKGSSGGEEVLFLRLHLLQSLLAYVEGNDRLARERLSKVEEQYGRLRLDTGKLDLLMSMGFTDQEARLGLRACHGDLDTAAAHISQRRRDKEELRKRERDKRKSRQAAINTLGELGFAKRDASRALHQASGDVDKAYGILLDASQVMDTASSSTASPSEPDKQTKVDQLAYLGFDQEVVEAALRLTDWEVTYATQLLLDNQGILPPELLSPSTSSPSEEPSTSSPSEEPSTSSESTGTASLDADLVNEVLEDIPQHEEDYLDMTLDEESEVIAQLRSFLERSNTTSG
ncbi:NEDD8 ultimate buster 1 [Clupea harengus]|uniref:NEDD8 ultimate buster 1 n=1 Tax=Clupea harengus TaxID=7950 RepID=A0A6P3VHN7_CLUHA|nr:NEDD8 ultimate buster 1 [Clupea harengus]